MTLEATDLGKASPTPREASAETTVRQVLTDLAPGEKQELDGSARSRRPYAKPKITMFGDIRDVTLGMTPGIGDSGNPALFRP